MTEQRTAAEIAEQWQDRELMIQELSNLSDILLHADDQRLFDSFDDLRSLVSKSHRYAAAIRIVDHHSGVDLMSHDPFLKVTTGNYSVQAEACLAEVEVLKASVEIEGLPTSKPKKVKSREYQFTYSDVEKVVSAIKNIGGNKRPANKAILEDIASRSLKFNKNLLRDIRRTIELLAQPKSD